MSLLTRNQGIFASTLARETGLNPHVVASWLLAEESAGAARGYEGRGYNNWLNIAITDSGPRGGSHSSVWRDPVSAGRATAQWIRGHGPITSEYGKAAPGIRGILSTAGSSPQAQINAIARSGWASSGYSGGSTLRSLYGQLSGEKLPSAPAGSPEATGGAEGPQPSSDATLATIARLQQELTGGSPASASLGSPPRFGGGWEPRSVLPVQAAQQPEDQMLALIKQLSEGGGGEASGGREPGQTSPGSYVHPLPGAKVGRTDQGVDLSAAPGTAIRAIGNARVLGVSPNWYKGQPYVAYELLDGPHAHRVVYNAEQITPQVRSGQRVRAGQRIGVVAPHGTALEFGWGSHTLGRTQAQATTGYREGQVTPAGKDFTRFYRGLR